MGWLDEAMVGLEYALDCPLSFNNVTLQTPGQSDVIIRMHEDLQVKQIVDQLVIEAENSFQDDEW